LRIFQHCEQMPANAPPGGELRGRVIFEACHLPRDAPRGREVCGRWVDGACTRTFRFPILEETQRPGP
jgi:hypothetical protein